MDFQKMCLIDRCTVISLKQDWVLDESINNSSCSCVAITQVALNTKEDQLLDGYNLLDKLKWPWKRELL